MTETARNDEPEPSIAPTDEEVDATIAEFGGDPREAVRALLHDIAILAHDRRRIASWGFLRGHIDLLKLP
jgi:hypothetical protein